MGLPVAVGLGLALAKPSKKIIVITGDGNFLMGLGSAITAAFYKPKNLKILILDNLTYFTTGGQPTVSPAINYPRFLESLGSDFAHSKKASPEEIENDLATFLDSETFAVLHLTIQGAKKNLTNIPWHPKEIAERFTKRLKDGE